MIVKHPNNKNIVAMVEGISDIAIIGIYQPGNGSDFSLIENVRFIDGHEKYYIDASVWDSFVKLVNETDKAIKESGINTIEQS